MKIRLKWILSAVVALLVGATVTVYAILSSLDFDDLRGVIEAQAKEATGRTLTITGPMDLAVSLSPTITIENLTFGNAPWGAWPELFSAGRLEVEVRLLPLLSGNIEVRRLIVLEPVLLLETNAEGQGNWALQSAGSDSKAAPKSDDESAAEGSGLDSIPAFRRIEVRAGRAIFRDGQSGQEYLVQIDSLDAWADTPDSPSQVRLRGSYNDTGFAAAGTLGSRSELLAGGQFPLDLTLEVGDSSLQVAGTVGALATFQGLDFQLDARGPRLTDIGDLIGTALPPLGPYTLAGRLSDTKEGMKIANLALKLGDSDLAGDLAMSFAGPRPAIAGTLSANAADLKDFSVAEAAPSPPTENEEPAASTEADKVATAATEADKVPTAPGERDKTTEAAAGATETADAKGAPARVFSAEPLGLEGLTVIDAQLELDATQVKIDDKTMLSDLSLEIDLKNGKLVARDVRGGLSGAAFVGDLTLDASAPNPPLEFKLGVKDFDYGHFLQGRDITDGVAGKLDADADLRAAGASLHAWARSLSGRVDLTGGEGRVRSDLLGASGAGLSDMLGAWREGDDDLKLNCVVMRLPVENGLMTTEAILVDTAAVTVGASGEIDLGKETLDLKVTPQAKQTSLLSLAVPVRVGGTLNDPSVGPDALGTAISAAKIAGMFINPLVAGAVIVLGSELSNQNPCVAAIEGNGKKEQSTEGEDAPKKKDGIEGLGDAINRGLQDIIRD